MNQTAERLIIVGGRQRKNALKLNEWQAYESAVIVEFDPAKGQAKLVVEYQSPQDVCPDESPSFVFKAGDLNRSDEHLLVCTQTEVMEFRLADWQRTFYYSHPSFNDLHHACYRHQPAGNRDRILVANTGLDQVMELRCDRVVNEKSTIINQWSTCEEITWERFDPKIDYRKVSTTKPHLSHPNFVFELDDEIYSTRFHQQDAINMNGDRKAIQIPAGNPHDGIVNGKSVYFTTTNGHVVVVDRRTVDCVNDVDLNENGNQDELLGWCRGICPLNDDQAWVGFSRLRPTWLRKNLSWIKQGFRSLGEYGTRPTRIARYALSRNELVEEFDLEPFGMNAVFGIYRLPKES